MVKNILKRLGFDDLEEIKEGNLEENYKVFFKNAIYTEWSYRIIIVQFKDGALASVRNHHSVSNVVGLNSIAHNIKYFAVIEKSLEDIKPSCIVYNMEDVDIEMIHLKRLEEILDAAFPKE